MDFSWPTTKGPPRKSDDKAWKELEEKHRRVMYRYGSSSYSNVMPKFKKLKSWRGILKAIGKETE